ncbi:alpha/beta hydrolase [Pseudomonas sp. NZIPFR-PS5]|nr:alpha/beta hydrolase [Pseudomonas sp. NZIPFR-PS5]
MTCSVEEIRLSLPHIELAAHLFGPQDGIPVIALHGWLDNANSFARLAPRLEGLRILALDMAGHGHSDHRPPGSAYGLPDYAHDVLQVAGQMGWERFSLLLALIDGLVPPVGEPESVVERMGAALKAQLTQQSKRKPVYSDMDRAVEARMKGMVAVSREAAELLAQRGLMPVPGGYTWRSDSRLTLPSAIRLTRAQALSFVAAVRCPAYLIVAEEGMLAQNRELLASVPFTVTSLPGGHHLHLNDEAGARSVADCFNRFFAVP